MGLRRLPVAGVGSLGPQNPALIVLREKGFDLGMYEPTYDPGEAPNDEELGFLGANKDSPIPIVTCMPRHLYRSPPSGRRCFSG